MNGSIAAGAPNSPRPCPRSERRFATSRQPWAPNGIWSPSRRWTSDRKGYDPTRHQTSWSTAWENLKAVTDLPYGLWHLQEENRMKIKSKKNRNTPKSNLVEPTDVLVCARVLKEMPDERLEDATYLFFKFALIEDGRLLGYSNGRDYVLVANLLDEASAGRVRENLVRNPVSDLRMCETPARSEEHT